MVSCCWAEVGAGQEVMREDKDDFYSYLCSSTLVSPWHARGPATANTKKPIAFVFLTSLRDARIDTCRDACTCTCVCGCWVLMWKSVNQVLEHQKGKGRLSTILQCFQASFLQDALFTAVMWGGPAVCWDKQLIPSTYIPFWRTTRAPCMRCLLLESRAVCLCNEVDGTALAHVCASQWCHCSKELRITVLRSGLCCCCPAPVCSLAAVLAWIHGRWESQGNTRKIQLKYL